MKFLYVVLLSLSLSYGSDLKVTSKVVRATVFKDRALVTRSAKAPIPAGISYVVFPDLTPEFENSSVTVSIHNKDIQIIDVNTQRKFTRDIHKENVRKIQEELTALNRQRKAYTDQIAIFNSKKDFIESLKAESVKYANMKILLNTASVKKWQSLLGFIDTNLNHIYSGIREQNRRRDALDKKIRVLKKRLKQFSGIKSKDYKEITVTLKAAYAAKTDIDVSYLVHNAGWYPMYDARIAPDAKEMNLAYFGMVQQGTGEDWKNINLKLSTVDPVSVKQLPRLTPWFIDVKPLPHKAPHQPVTRSRSDMQVEYSQNMGLPHGTGAITGYVLDKDSGEPLAGVNLQLDGTSMGALSDARGKFYMANIPAKRYTLSVNYFGYQSIRVNLYVVEKQITHLNLSMQEESLQMDEAVVVTAQRPYVSAQTSYSMIRVEKKGIQQSKKSDYTTINSGDVNTTFTLKSKNNIPSDNNMHKVTIDRKQLPMQIEYTATPKLLEKVYLKGKAVNINNYPLLEGDINIYVDNNFVNKSFIQTIVPTDTIKLALGYDDNIKIKKTLKNKFLESKGFLNGSRKVTYTYEIRITNNRKVPATLTVFDQAPRSMNANLKVSMIQPAKGNAALKKDGRIIWHIHIKPGQSVALPLKFSVEFPADIKVYGLE